jgi:aldehyde:ferredoxin oxidoreductase
MKIVRVNVRTKIVTMEELPQDCLILGNRGLIAHILLNEVPPICEPLGRRNKLIFANGPFALAGVSSAQRISAGAKSPLTGGIKESNAGGIGALRMAQHGIRALVIEDKPEDKDALEVLVISADGYEFTSANEYKRMGTRDITRTLQEKYGSNAAVICIGPAGEMLMSTAGIVITDKDGNPARHCARGGLGAVMGSKGLKAIVIKNDGSQKLEIQNPDAFKESIREYVNELRTAHQTGVGYPQYGTVGIIPSIDQLGGLPSYSFRSGRFDRVDDITGEAVRQTILKRGGEGDTTHACMPGCIVRCSNIFPDGSGKHKVASFEYETVAMLGSNLGISNLDTIAELNALCNDYGIDTIEVGVAIGVYMDVGLARFGDEESAVNLVNEIGRGTLLGKVLGEGAVVTGRIFKSLRVPAVKGQSMAGHEPRSIKGLSVTYAMTPMGADHTVGITTRAQMDHLDPTIQMELVRGLNVKVATVDTLGLCVFVTTAGAKIPPLMVRFLNAIYGTEYDERLFETLGKKVILMEREFNIKAGLNEAADRIPEFMKEEPMPPHNAVSDIPAEHYRRYWEKDFWSND